MDGALAHKRNEQFHSYRLVLILVVMDDVLALWTLLRRRRKQSFVLILVVMDDALAPSTR